MQLCVFKRKKRPLHVNESCVSFVVDMIFDLFSNFKWEVNLNVTLVTL